MIEKNTTFGFLDQYVLVAGGFRGMGLELARLLLDDGANVAVIGRDSDRGEKARQILSRPRMDPHRLKIIQADLSREELLQDVQVEVEQVAVVDVGKGMVVMDLMVLDLLLQV